MGAISKRAREEVPGSTAIRGGAAQEGRAVKDFDCRVGIGGAGECQRFIVGDVVADGAAVIRKRNNCRRRCDRDVYGDSSNG